MVTINFPSPFFSSDVVFQSDQMELQQKTTPNQKSEVRSAFEQAADFYLFCLYGKNNCRMLKLFQPALAVSQYHIIKFTWCKVNSDSQEIL